MEMASVYISASTQEHNLGKLDFGTEEQRMNQIADVVEILLKKHDVTVFRNKPTMTLGETVADSNRVKPNIHLAIHSNAMGVDNSKARGCECYCHRFGGEGEKLARLVYDEISLITPTSDRGVREGINHYGPNKPMYETAKTNAPACLCETAFHDNVEDAKWMVANITLIGTAYARAILKYFNIQFKVDELQQLAQDMFDNGLITDVVYWKAVLQGDIVPNIDYLVVTFRRAISKIKK